MQHMQEREKRMKKIGFIGAYDKTDVILSVAKVLTMAGKKVLIMDNTIIQKCSTSYKPNKIIYNNI